MNKFLVYTFVWCTFHVSALAQQLPLLSQFQESVGVLNPAAIPAQYFQYEQNVRITASHHNQWVDIEGSPTTSQLSAQIILEDYEPMAPIAGVYLINDQTGPTGFTGAYFKFGGILSDDPYNYGLSAAFQLGVNQYQLRISDLVLRDEETVYAAGNNNQISPDAGLGLFAYNRFGNTLAYAGFSMPQVLGLNLNFRGQDGQIQTQRYRHYYAQLGAILDFGDYSFLEPSAWLKYVPGIPLNVNMNLRYQTPSLFFLGVGASTAKSVHGEAGIIIGDRTGFDPNLRVGYGFDVSLQRFGPFAGPSHEIQLTYSFTR